MQGHLCRRQWSHSCTVSHCWSSFDELNYHEKTLKSTIQKEVDYAHDSWNRLLLYSCFHPTRKPWLALLQRENGNEMSSKKWQKTCVSTQNFPWHLMEIKSYQKDIDALFSSFVDDRGNHDYLQNCSSLHSIFYFLLMIVELLPTIGSIKRKLHLVCSSTLIDSVLFHSWGYWYGYINEKTRDRVCITNSGLSIRE